MPGKTIFRGSGVWREADTVFSSMQILWSVFKRPLASIPDFFDWYHFTWFDLKSWQVSKKDDGQQNGSLVKTIYELHKEKGIDLKDIRDARKPLVNQSIHIRVQHYFGLFDSIRDNGYDLSLSLPIECWYRDGLYWLENGHHRTAALYNLDCNLIPLKVLV